MARANPKMDMRAFETVSGVLASITSPEEMLVFLKELLTPGEVYDISLRWKLLELLVAGVAHAENCGGTENQPVQNHARLKDFETEGRGDRTGLENSGGKGCRKKGVMGCRWSHARSGTRWRALRGSVKCLRKGWS